MASTVSAFLNDRLIASGDTEEMTRLIEERYFDDHNGIMVFDDNSGRVTDLDYWDASGRFFETAGRNLSHAPPLRTRGRPRLGVIAREVTLLPRHWDWLATRSGGASSALRRLVDDARRAEEAAGRTERQRRDAAYHFMQAMCGDMPDYEEALRALYKGDDAAFSGLTAKWPEDIRTYIRRLLE